MMKIYTVQELNSSLEQVIIYLHSIDVVTWKSTQLSDFSTQMAYEILQMQDQAPHYL